MAKVRTQGNSNEKNLERENSHNQQFNIHKVGDSRKRTPSAGKNLLRTNNRTSSKGTESSLDKEEQSAKKINADLINTMMKNQISPNYINKVK